MNHITVAYQGQLRQHITYPDSPQTVFTDGPAIAGGLPGNPSPVELLAGSFAACALTIMALRAESLGADFSGCTAEVADKEVSMKEFRIKKLALKFNLKQAFNAEVRQAVESAVTDMCIVGRSLHPDLVQTFEFNYQ
ncbi:OsmC family protein [Testudinibacter sp. TR-2022]|uniref:OsmC family protein n=1 Tax=Testudinibacter sp. TR-2022 TaxID=2585029 RepID=UPI001119A07D|nr:OsmC family protein [Testudinibacter sp. TR-2022]TNH04369.1 OsmC family protein [Pasteurellaceae bacterium Phil11]TNH23170.1 OsmC family protein [Testudinibacter sp. TR-2022]TNH23654.1 OsmC family protein [Testudinibacter sp. TR-2022]